MGWCCVSTFFLSLSWLVALTDVLHYARYAEPVTRNVQFLATEDDAIDPFVFFSPTNSMEVYSTLKLSLRPFGSSKSKHANLR